MRSRILILAAVLLSAACSEDPRATASSSGESAAAGPDPEYPWSVPASWNVEERDITFESDGVRLRGTLYSPEGVENGPALVVVQQAGTETRG